MKPYKIASLPFAMTHGIIRENQNQPSPLIPRATPDVSSFKNDTLNIPPSC